MSDPFDSDVSPPGDPASSTGLPPNVAAALSYFLGPITGILFLLFEKRNPFVRFHAAQSIGVSLVFIIINAILSFLTSILALVPLVGWLAGFLLGMGIWAIGLILWLFLMYQAWQGNRWLFPFIGTEVEKILR